MPVPSQPSQPITLPLLLNAVPDRPSFVLSSLTTHPDLAHAADAHGYTLLHAAASYNQLALLHALLQPPFAVDPNTLDEDAETALFVCETVDAAQALVAAGADPAHRNRDGDTARARIEAEGEFQAVADYLRTLEADADAPPPPPTLPDGVQLEFGTVTAEADGGEDGAGGLQADPEFRRRIEELAAREDFQSEAGQRELRELIREALGGVAMTEGEQDGGGPAKRLRE